ncbi:MAG: anthranilate phosphoribosyltransferase family protein [Limnothrix sp.]
MSTEFRELLKKVGSGQHTSKGLSRSEAADALQMMIDGVATPAQIGGFLISHRIKRPTGIEIAGMLDTYDKLSTKLTAIAPEKTVYILGIPYDGRSRTAPISPITSLILKTVGIPVVMHGGDRLPTKYGIPLIEIWQHLGLDFQQLSVAQLQDYFTANEFALCYAPTLLPDSTNLISYREEIGKRPPIATLELIWSPYAGDNIHTLAGYVHPPTEEIIRDTFTERGNQPYTLIKGLEGSGDLRISQTTIVVTNQTDAETGIEYLKPNPYDHGLGGEDVAIDTLEVYVQSLEALLKGEESTLLNTAIWNGGFYLWHCGAAADLKAGIKQASNLIQSGQLAETLEQLKAGL